MEENWNPFGPQFQTTKVLSRKSRNGRKLKPFWTQIPNHKKFFKKNPEMEGNWNPFGPPKFQTTKVLSEKSRNVYFSGTFSFTFSQPSTLKM